MMLSPGVFALTASSAVAVPIMVYASGVAVTILHGWDLESGSERQLRLERRTFLVSTVVNCVMAYQIFALFMFVYTTDHLHGSFIGTMCAAGTLNVNPYGYPTLVLKLIKAILCGLWNVVNHTDNQAFDYPLIRFKYRFLLLITLLLVLEALLQWKYLTRLRPDIISSCCGVLFGATGRSLTGGLASLPPIVSKVAFYSSSLLTLSLGLCFLLTRRMARTFSLLSGWLLLVSLVSVISFISLYYYELPTHHCPFCLLQREYHFVGYPMYISLLSAAVFGASVGIVDPFKSHPSLSRIVPPLQVYYCVLSMACFMVFSAIATYPMLFSELRLEGY